MLENPNATASKTMAFSQYPRCPEYSMYTDVTDYECLNIPRNNISHMGFSVRVDNARCEGTEAAQACPPSAFLQSTPCLAPSCATPSPPPHFESSFSRLGSAATDPPLPCRPTARCPGLAFRPIDTEWRKWKQNCVGDWTAGGLVAAELYDHVGDKVGLQHHCNHLLLCLPPPMFSPASVGWAVAVLGSVVHTSPCCGALPLPV